MNLPNAGENETKEYKGFMNMPVDLQLGHNYKCSDATTFQASVKYGADLEVHNVVSHKLNSNVTAKMHQHFFSKNINTDSNAVDVGFELSYKL